MTFEVATQATVTEFLGGPPPFSLRGYVARVGGRVVGLGGVYYDAGRAVAFSKMKDEMRPKRKACAKACRMLVDLIRETPGPVYAIASPDEATAPALLQKLGFVPTGVSSPHGPLLQFSKGG